MHLSSAYLIQGVITGLAISISIGPIALLTVKRTAEFGLRAGLAGGAAVILIDTAVAILILFGIHHSHSFFIHIPKGVRFIIALCIFMYGITLFRKKAAPVHIDHPLDKHFSETMLLSLANPSTYVSFGIIALLLTRFIGMPVFNRTEVVIGFLVGAVLWWGSLVALSHHHRDRIGISQLQKIVGILIMGLAVLLVCAPNHPEFIPIITRLIHP